VHSICLPGGEWRALISVTLVYPYTVPHLSVLIQVESIGLPGGEWHIVDHMPEASTGVVDFVLSDNQQRWDNNSKRDYHTRVKINVDPQQLAQVPNPICRLRLLDLCFLN
jgi:hypothetical protein